MIEHAASTSPRHPSPQPCATSSASPPNVRNCLNSEGRTAPSQNNGVARSIAGQSVPTLLSRGLGPARTSHRPAFCQSPRSHPISQCRAKGADRYLHRDRSKCSSPLPTTRGGSSGALRGRRPEAVPPGLASGACLGVGFSTSCPPINEPPTRSQLNTCNYLPFAPASSMPLSLPALLHPPLPPCTATAGRPRRRPAGCTYTALPHTPSIGRNKWRRAATTAAVATSL